MSQLSQEPQDIGRLKAALWFSIGKIVEEEARRLGTQATPQFIGVMTEVAWGQLENTARDLETFATHGGRSTINTADVLLVTRRNDALHGIIQDFIEKEKVGDELENGGRGGPTRKSGKSSGKGKGKGRAREA